MRSVRRKAATLLLHRLGQAHPADAATPGSTVALGDSLTAGHTMPELRVLADDSYVDILAHDLTIPLVANRASHGATSARVARRAPERIPRGIARVVVLAGTNDVLNKPHLDTVEHLEIIRRLIIDRGAQPVFGLLPPIDLRPVEVCARNELIRAWATEQDVALIDHWTPLAGPDGRYLPGMSTDGVHPTAAGARAMADAARPHLRGSGASR